MRVNEWQCGVLMLLCAACTDDPGGGKDAMSYSPRIDTAQVRVSEKTAEKADARESSGVVLPAGFVHADEMVSGLLVDLRYLGRDNFVGRPIQGYHAHRLVMSEAAAVALMDVQEDLGGQGLGLKVFDAYRPVKAVDDLVDWAQDLEDTMSKQEYYPHLHKSSLLSLGYISARSGHSRGSAIDLTLVYGEGENRGKQLDMGTAYDHFGSRSGWNTIHIGPEQRENRLILKRAMEEHGFRSIKGEWWHYVLRDEPFPETYFDFDIR